MKISAIICEFNPIHTGHKKLIQYAHTISDVVVCIMSGNFVQRGMPACCDKYSRAKHAILCGADMVIELPTIFATSSAENFALGGVKIANQIGADFLVFGSECGDIKQLEKCVDLLEKEEINEKIKQNVSKGASYPKAVSDAIGCDTLATPNNVLAIEYLKAIKSTKSKIIPKTIKRENNYNEQIGYEFASSTALRNDYSLLDKYSFDFVAKDINEKIENNYLTFAPHYLSLLDAEQMSNIEGISEGIENKIVSANKSNGYDTMMEEIKSKRYTRAKLQRIVLNVILGITKEQTTQAKANVVEAKVLAIKKEQTTLIQLTDNQTSALTDRADRFYISLGGKIPPLKLQKI